MKPTVGLCKGCVFGRIVENSRGSVFFLCRWSEEDPRYPKYPQLPVLTCPSFQPAGDPHAQEAEG